MCENIKERQVCENSSKVPTSWLLVIRHASVITVRTKCQGLRAS